MTENKGLPVQGYKATQPQWKIDLVNEGKQLEERVLRWIEKVESHGVTFVSVQDPNPNSPAKGGLIAKAAPSGEIDMRFSAIGKTDIQKGFMAVARSIFQPERIKLPEDQE